MVARWSGTGDCERPSCSGDAEKHYSGPNDNRLHLCKSCYFRLVTDERSLTDPLGLGTDQLFQPEVEREAPEESLTTQERIDLREVPDGVGPSSGELVEIEYDSDTGGASIPPGHRR